MAGGPNAAIVLCPLCAGKAVRIREGLEDDLYRCEDCSGKFGIDWSHGQPQKPCWPPAPEELAVIKQMIGATEPEERSKP